jgi:hypothetical protein
VTDDRAAAATQAGDEARAVEPPPPELPGVDRTARETDEAAFSARQIAGFVVLAALIVAGVRALRRRSRRAP